MHRHFVVHRNHTRTKGLSMCEDFGMCLCVRLRVRPLSELTAHLVFPACGVLKKNPMYTVCRPSSPDAVAFARKPPGLDRDSWDKRRVAQKRQRVQDSADARTPPAQVVKKRPKTTAGQGAIDWDTALTTDTEPETDQDSAREDSGGWWKWRADKPDNQGPAGKVDQWVDLLTLPGVAPLSDLPLDLTSGLSSSATENLTDRLTEGALSTQTAEPTLDVVGGLECYHAVRKDNGQKMAVLPDPYCWLCKGTKLAVSRQTSSFSLQPRKLRSNSTGEVLGWCAQSWHRTKPPGSTVFESSPARRHVALPDALRHSTLCSFHLQCPVAF